MFPIICAGPACIGVNLHDLLPIPYTREALGHVCERILRVQDFLGRRIAIENASTYVAFAQADMSEAEFVAAMAARADCLLLLDVNNVYVSNFNHSPRNAALDNSKAFIDAVPAARVAQIHMAGHSDLGEHKIDTHDHPICEEVFALYRHVCARVGHVPTMIERDDGFPPFAELLDELRRLRAIAAHACKTPEMADAL